MLTFLEKGQQKYTSAVLFYKGKQMSFFFLFPEVKCKYLARIYAVSLVP